MGSEAGDRPEATAPVLDSGAGGRTRPPAHRSIGAWSHGVIDYLMIVILAIGPSVAGFTGRQATLAYVLAVVLFILTIFTRFPLGALKVISFPTHGAIECAIGVLLLIFPWLANFARGTLSRNFFVLIGVLLLAIWALTDFRGVRNRPAVGPANMPPTGGP